MVMGKVDFREICWEVIKVMEDYERWVFRKSRGKINYF